MEIFYTPYNICWKQTFTFTIIDYKDPCKYSQAKPMINLQLTKPGTFLRTFRHFHNAQLPQKQGSIYIYILIYPFD